MRSGAMNNFWISHMGIRGTNTSAFPGILVGSWIRNETVGSSIGLIEIPVLRMAP